MVPEPDELLTDLLEDVSRSFYKTLRVLPRSIRTQISLAYLLARTTDTIADTEILPVDQRLESLQQLRGRILGTSKAPLDFRTLAQRQSLPAERRLLEAGETALALLEKLSETDRRLLREVLEIITRGQELDIVRFAGASSQNVIALRTDAELEDYTYRVAGCVGAYWTKMCRLHVFPWARLEDATLLAGGVRFGQGLQLVNILRDLPADVKSGRCYLPVDMLAKRGLTPMDLRTPANESRLRPLYNELLDRAQAHLAAGWDYTNSLPWRCVRVRLGCAWPILIGLRTLARLRTGNVLDPRDRIKISRAEVRSLVLQSVARYPLPGGWRKLARFNAPA